jgi:lauroyl/myristoyl acyltransferase
VIREPQGLDPKLPLPEYLQQMNKNLEAIIRSNMAQFEWGYKRFKTPPDGDYDFYPE